MKGIVITEETQKVLASRYGFEDYDVPAILPLGYILVTDFGNEETFDLLSKETFDLGFTKGATLKNEWFDIVGNPS